MTKHTPEPWKMKLWGIAEKADWYGVWPKRFWRWLLCTMDKSYGYESTNKPEESSNNVRVERSP